MSDNIVAIVRQIEALDENAVRDVADLLDYTSAMTLYEQLRRRLMEDGAPIKTDFEDQQ